MNRKKLLYLSTHRGCKEIDIILGKFAEENLDKLTDDELIIYEKILLEPDGLIYDSLTKIICEKTTVDNQLNYATDLLKKISQDYMPTLLYKD
jgi:antitoxin CptB